MALELMVADILGNIPALRLYAFFLSRSHDQADDLVQDTLERAWRRRDTFRPGSNPRAWLFRILRNRFTDEYRRHRNTVEDVDGQNAALLLYPADQHWRLQYGELLMAINALPPTTRDAVLLTMGAGLSHEDAAKILGCPLGTLKSRIRRARANLLSIVEIETVSIKTPKSSSR
jgi:RNA polymerase sigma-70 factor (ECF subfamily)